MRSRTPLISGLLLACSLSLAAQTAVDPEFQPVCTYDSALCGDFQSLKSQLLPFAPNSQRPGQKPPRAKAAQIAAFNQSYQSLSDRSETDAFQQKISSTQWKADFVPALSSIRSMINAISVSVIPLDLSAVESALTGQETKLTLLEQDVAAAGQPIPAAPQQEFIGRLTAINDVGTRIWNLLRTDAMNTDRMGSAEQFKRNPDGTVSPGATPTGKLEEAENPLESRVARLARRLKALDQKLGAGLSGPPVADPASAQAAKDAQDRAKNMLKDPFSPAAPAGPAAPAAPQAPAPPAKTTLLDMKLVPLPAKVQPAAQPPLDFGTGAKDGDPAGTQKILAARQAGRTATFGDPAARAKFAFRQNGETCAIASQVELLEAAGAIPADPHDQSQGETQLFDKAALQDFFTGNPADPNRRAHGGTPGQYVGDLLGFPVVKHIAASDDDLFRAVSSGKMVIVGVNAGVLWNDPRYLNGGHAIVVTGVEVDKSSGRPLGYYINDTGTGEGGRLVTAKQFSTAWAGLGRNFVEPL